VIFFATVFPGHDIHFFCYGVMVFTRNSPRKSNFFKKEAISKVYAKTNQDYLGLPQEFDKKRLRYKLNGLLSLFILLGGFAAAAYYRLFNPKIVIDNFSEIVMTAQIASILMCIFLYIKGTQAKDVINQN
jgi:hypothetical protein